MKKLALFASLLAMLATPALAQSDRLNLKLPIPLPLDRPAAAPAATASLPTLGTIMAQIEAVQAQTVADVIADINAADADAGTVVTPANGAVAAIVKDPIAHACYPALVQFLQSLPTAKPPTGTLVGVQTFQDSRDFIAQIQAGIPTYLKLGCAPLLGDEVNIVIQALGLVGIKIGAAAITAALPGLAPLTIPALTLTP